MKTPRLVSLLVLTLALVTFGACAHTKTVETHENGGTIKFRRRGITKDLREEKAMGEADENCKRNGYKTYKVESEVQDGRFTDVRYICVN